MAWWKKDSLRDELDQIRRELNEVRALGAGSVASLLEAVPSVGTVSVSSQGAAMRCSAVFACVRLVAGAVASARIKIYRQSDSGLVPERHPYYRLLARRPNEYMTAATFWRTMMESKLLHGNAYAAILRAPSGRATGLVPLNPQRVTPYQAWELGLDKRLGVDRFRLYYSVTWDDGGSTMVDRDDILHVPNLGWDGKRGLSTLRAGARAIGLALSAEESSSSLFANGLMTQVALTYPQRLTPDAQERLRESLEARYSGAGNHHRPLILTEGGDVKTLSLSADDAQLLEARQFSVVDIARFFGVPPVMIGETDKTTSWGSGVEQMARWFVMFTLNDHFTALEEEIDVKLFSGSDFVAEFDETELTRGDTKTRSEYYRVMRGSIQEPGLMTVNEIRAAEGLPPVPGGDELLRPMTMDLGHNDGTEGADDDAE